jgi:hypothetical protein
VNFPGFTGTGGTTTQHPDLRDSSKQLLDKDRPQMLNISWAYELPFGAGRRYLSSASGFVNQVVGGWRLSAIQNYLSGTPFTVTSRSSIPGGFSSIWPVSVPNVPIISTGCADYNPSDPSRNRYLNSAAFANPAPFTLGNITRPGNARRCGFMDEALQAEKDFRITEQARIQFGTMIMNLFNRHAWTSLNTDINNPSAFGKYSGASSPRNVQLFLKFHF